MSTQKTAMPMNEKMKPDFVHSICFWGMLESLCKSDETMTKNTDDNAFYSPILGRPVGDSPIGRRFGVWCGDLISTWRVSL
jgi:hypothetical protein